MSLKNRVYLANAVLLGITVMGALAMIWYTYKNEGLFSNIVDRHIPLYQSAEALETHCSTRKAICPIFFWTTTRTGSVRCHNSRKSLQPG